MHFKGLFVFLSRPADWSTFLAKACPLVSLGSEIKNCIVFSCLGWIFFFFPVLMQLGELIKFIVIANLYFVR